MRFEYTRENRIASRGQGTGGGLVHRTEKTGSDPFRSRIVSYCSIGMYVPDARFAPSLDRRPPGSILDVHRAISGEIVERSGIKLYRISDSPSGLAILELSVIDGPWRTYRLLTRSQNYSEFTLLRVTAWTRTVSENARRCSCSNGRSNIWLREPFLFTKQTMIAASLLLSLQWTEFARDMFHVRFVCFEKQ